MDVASWLRSLGLEKYEPLFRENEIDADFLPELTEPRIKRVTSSQRLEIKKRKVATANGGQWRHVQVRQILDRASR